MNRPSADAPQDTVVRRILIADDHPFIRNSVKAVLETMDAVQLVAEATDGEDALEKILRLAPDIALIDLSMPRLSGIEILQRLGDARVTRIIVLTGHDDEARIRSLFAAGADGYLPKTATPTELTAAVEAVLSGEKYVHSRAFQALSESADVPPAGEPA